MKIYTSILGINSCYRNKQIACHFNSFNCSVPVTWIFTVRDNELIDRKVLVGTMPIHIRIFVKEVSDRVLILSQHRLNKTAYIHNCLPRKFRFAALLSFILSHNSIKHKNSHSSATCYDCSLF